MLLPAKLCGVFAAEVAQRHELTDGLAAPLTPHSRYNGLDERELTDNGYLVLTRSARAGVRRFVKPGATLERSRQVIRNMRPTRSRVSFAAICSATKVQKASRLKVLKVYRAHTRRTPEQIEQLLEQIHTARPLTTDRAVIESSALMARAQVDQLRALAAGLERLEEKLQELFAAHPDQAIFRSFPGAGPALAPRLLAAWGTDRQRYAAAQDMECLSGAAPVTDQSGKKCWVHWRLACPKFLRQTFHEFAGQSILWSPWARAYYQQMRQRGLDHHPAVRSLAFKWIRILDGRDRQPALCAGRVSGGSA